MIKIIEGDITKTDKDIIVQQVNCLGLMGSGLAKTIMARYPNVREEYKKFWRKAIKNRKNEDLLGMVNYVDTYDGKIVANVFGQIEIRKGKEDTTVYTKKEALLKGIQKVKELAEKSGFSVAIPTYIGCGLAGGDWNEIKQAIDELFAGSTIDVSYYHYRS